MKNHALAATLALLAGVAVLFALTGTARADFPVSTSYRFQGFELDGLHDPTTSKIPATAALRLGDVAVCAGIPWSIGVNGAFRCGAPGTDYLDPSSVDGVTVGVSGTSLQRLALTFTGAVTGTMAAGSASLALTFGAAGAHTLLGVPGGSGVPTYIGPASPGQVFMADPSTGVISPEIPPLVTLSSAGYMSAADKLKINGGVTPTVSTDLLRFGDLTSCPGVIDWTGTAFTCAPTLGFDSTLRLVSGLLGLAAEPGFTILGVGGSSTAQPGAITATGSRPETLLYDGSSSVAWVPTSPSTSGAVATWSPAGIRVFAVDPAGSDANLCWADSPDITQANIAIAIAAAHATPCATLAGAAAEGPPLGAGRIVAVDVLGGNTTYADGWSVFDRWRGYREKIIFATATNASAGATAFTGSTADLTFNGSRTCAGMNAAGYHPTSSGTATSMTLALAGGGSPSFAAEPAKPLYCRLRGDAATTTVADRNAVFAVVQVNNATTLTVDNSLTFATTDTFYLEEAGALAPGGTFAGDSASVGLSGVQATSSLAFVGGGGGFYLANVTGTSIGANSSANVNTSTELFIPPFPVVGPVLDTGPVSVSGSSVYLADSTFGAYSSLSVTGSPSFRLGGQCHIGGDINVTGGTTGALATNSALYGGNAAATPNPARVGGMMTLNAANINIGHINFYNTTSPYGIYVSYQTTMTVTGYITGGLKTDAGISFADAQGARIWMWSAAQFPVVTGVNGDSFWGKSGTGANPQTGIYESWAGLYGGGTGQRAGAFIYPNGATITVTEDRGATGTQSGQPQLLTAVGNFGQGLMPRGSVVHAVFTDGIAVAYADASTAATLPGTICILADNIPNLANGFAVCDGQAVAIHDPAETMCTNITDGGHEVYVSAVTPGTYTCERPAIARTLGWLVGEHTIQLQPENDLQPISSLYNAGTVQNTEPGLNLIFPTGTPTFSDNPGSARTDLTFPSWALTSTTVQGTAPINIAGDHAAHDISSNRVWALDANGVTNSFLAQMGAGTIKGNNTGGTANAADLTAAQVTAMLNPFSSTLQGVAPLSGGGTTNFLRADGTWAAPGGTAGITALTGDGTASGPGSAPFTLHNIPTAVTKAGYVNATGIAAPATPATGHGNEYYDSSVQNVGVITEAGTFKHGVETLSAVAHTYLTGINDAGFPSSALVAEADVTSLSADLSTINTTLAGKQPTGNYVTSGTGPVMFAGPGAAATTVNLGAGGFTGTLPIVDLAPGSSGQQITMVGSTPTWVTPTAGTTYTGLPPIVVNAGTGQISCPTCGTSSGTVTAVTALSPLASSGGATPQITISLPAGQAAYGTGSNVTSNAAFTYATGSDNTFTVAGAGGATNTATAIFSANAGGGFFRAYGSGFSVASLANRVGFGNNTGLGSQGIVIFGNSASTSGGGGSISLRGGGYDTAAENLILDASGSRFTHGSLTVASLTTAMTKAVAGVLTDASSGDIAAALGMPTANLVILSGGPSAAPYGDPAFSLNPSTHIMTSSAGSVLGGSVVFSGAAGAGENLLGVGNTGAYELGFVGTGLSFAGGVLGGVPFVASGGSHSIGMVPDPGATAGTSRVLHEDATWSNSARALVFDATIANPTVGGNLSTSNGTGFAGTASEYPLGVAAKKARMLVRVTDNTLTYSGLMTFSIYLNGGNLGCSVGAISSSGSTPPGTLLDTGVCAALGTTAVTDVWSLVLTSTGTYAGGSISFTAVLMTDP